MNDPTRGLGERQGILDQPVAAALQPILADLERDETAAPRAPASALEWSQSYEQVRPLGRGGMGRTILARDRSTGSLACIKELFPSVEREVLEQEYKALSRLTHRNIERVLHIDVDASPMYLVAEYIEGTTLSSFARSWPSRNEREIARVMRPLADAIAYLHANAIIHRDLKPENVLVEVGGGDVRPVVIDLGLAVVDSYDSGGSITATGRIIGTPAYMAPEQLAGEMLTPACDVYALGVILYELATGRAAYAGSPVAVFAAKVERASALVIPDRLFRKQWRTLGPLVTACTEPPKERRPSAAEVAAVLSRLL